MSDQQNNTESVHKIVIDANNAEQTIGDLTREVGNLAQITKEAKEGITHIGGEYQFANKNLQEWYDNLKKLGLAHNKLTVDIVSGMQSAATASAQYASASEEHGKKLTKTSEGFLDSLHHQKIAFEDIGRAIEGEGFGLRQFAQNFALVGPGVAAIAFAVAELLPELVELFEKQDEAKLRQQEYTDTLVKSAEKVADVTENIHKMSETFIEARTGVVSKEEALKEYNKTFGASLGIAKDYNEAEKLFVEKSEAYKAAVTQRAIADAAYALAKEKITEQLKKQAENEIGFFANLRSGVNNFFSGVEAAGESAKKSAESQNKELQKVIDNYNKIGDTATAAANKIDTANGIKTGEDKFTKEKKEHDNSLDELKRYISESAKILQNAEEKELTNEQIKYEKIRADLIEHHHSTEALEEQHQKNIADIQQKYYDIFQKQLQDFKIKTDIAAQKDIDRETALFLKADADRNAKRLAAEEKGVEDRIRWEKEFERAVVKANRDADKEIVNSQTLSFKQKLDLLKKSLDGFKELQKEQGYLSDVDQKRQTDDLNAYKQVLNEKLRAQQAAAQGITTVLNSVAEVLGKSTAAGKALAIAAATISAIQGAVNAFTSLSVIPIVGPALGAVAAAAALVAGYANVKKIQDVKVPGESSGGGNGGSATSGAGQSGGAAPQIPQRTFSTNLSSNTISQIKPGQNQSDPIKAVVVERDITNSQHTLRGYSNAGTLGH